MEDADNNNEEDISYDSEWSYYQDNDPIDYEYRKPSWPVLGYRTAKWAITWRYNYYVRRRVTSLYFRLFYKLTGKYPKGHVVLMDEISFMSPAAIKVLHKYKFKVEHSPINVDDLFGKWKDNKWEKNI